MGHFGAVALFMMLTGTKPVEPNSYCTQRGSVSACSTDPIAVQFWWEMKERGWADWSICKFYPEGPVLCSVPPLDYQ